MYFSKVAKSGEISFSSLETKKTILCAIKEAGKSQNPWGPKPLLALSSDNYEYVYRIERIKQTGKE